MADQVASQSSSRGAKIAIFWLVIVAVIGLGAFVALREEPLLSEAKAAVRTAMKDPASVEFRNGRVSNLTDYACGEYNAKNSFGAYAGYRPFVYSKKEGLQLNMDAGLAAIICK